MKQNVRELVDVILRGLQDSSETLSSEMGLRKWLSKKGYAKRDIDAAINLVRPRIESNLRIEELGPGLVRQLLPYEEFKLTKEAKHGLARLQLYALLDPVEVEVILERLDHFEGTVGLDELEYLVSWVSGSTRDAATQGVLFDVLDNKGDTLQ